MFAVAVSLALIQLALGQSDDTCPAEHLRFDPKPSYCLFEPNPNCNILARGVTEEEKALILDEHNRRRNAIAMGQETGGGGLPAAADMMELVWDDDLAIPAQRWVEQCKNGHDCEDSHCREVLDYGVGQNIGLSYSGPKDSSNWTYIMKKFYGEINNFNPSIIPSYYPSKSEATEYGHFAQLIWAKTWRIGCGWVLYGPTPFKDDPDVYSQRYGCDYGPTGNVGGTPVYEEGDPCSGCPENSCCGDDCKDKDMDSKYPGLCKMLDDNTAPVYKVDKTEYNLYCDFRDKSDEDSRKRRDEPIYVDSNFFDSDSDSDEDSDDESGGVTDSAGAVTDGNGGDKDSCAYTTSDDDKCKLLRTLGGNFLECKLSGGESVTITFPNGFTAAEMNCVNLRFRLGPSKAGDQDAGQLKMKVGYLEPTDVGTSAEFLNFHFGSVPADTFSSVTLEFSVPDGAPDQILDVANIYDKSPTC